MIEHKINDINNVMNDIHKQLVKLTWIYHKTSKTDSNDDTFSMMWYVINNSVVVYICSPWDFYFYISFWSLCT